MHTIKDLIGKWFSKSFIYDVLKQSLPLSKQFNWNKRFFNEKDIEIFSFYKEYGHSKTVSKYWTPLKIDDLSNSQKTVSQTVQPVLENSSNNNPNTTNTDIKKAVLEEIETVKKQFLDKEVKLKKELEQKESIIKIKDEQNQKYALLKQEEKKEKEEWIKKYDVVQKEKNDWIGKYYSIKMYMVVFLILLILASLFIVFQNVK